MAPLFIFSKERNDEMAQAMKFELATKSGVLLETEGKYCTQNIMVEPVLADLTVTENGTYPVPEGAAGFGDVQVHVIPDDIVDLTVTENGTYPVPEGKDGYGEVTVDVQPKLTDITIDSNGVYPVPEGYDGYGSVNVYVQLHPIEKHYTLEEYTDTLTLYLNDVGFTGSTRNCLSVSSVKPLDVKTFGYAFDWREVPDPDGIFDRPDPTGDSKATSVADYVSSSITISAKSFFFAGDAHPVLPVYIHDMYGIRACLWIKMGHEDVYD